MTSRPCILQRIFDELCAPSPKRHAAFLKAATLARRLSAAEPKLADHPYLDKPLSMIGVILTAEPKLYDASHALFETTLAITKEPTLSACTRELLNVLEKTPHHANHKGDFNGLMESTAPAAMRTYDWPTQTSAQQIARLLHDPAMHAARELLRSYQHAHQTKNDDPA